jgi:hypothetical protein
MLIIKIQSWIQQKNEGGGSLRNSKSLSSVKRVMNDLRRRSIFVSINPKCIHIDDKDAGGGI